ncbi:MAG: AAA family ATPase [Theionarchaea archaeon]|nr:AAA family ATPase [Theionarchaea archaeon]MBU7022249.1 AAA family ATPase [Theionarchaea archaeon]
MMKFLTITLRGIRNFDQRRIQFQDGLNIICGPNESGKTTIVDSLLFSMTEEGQYVRDLIQWDSAHSSITLQYETDEGGVYTLTRTLCPEEKSTLENTRILEDEGVIRNMLREHFGCISRIVLENSAVVKHNEMEIMRKMGSRDIVKKQIQAFLTGGTKRSPEEVMETLDRSIFQTDRALIDIDNEIEHEHQNLQPYLGATEKYEKLANEKTVYQEDMTRFQELLETYKSRVQYGNLVQEIKYLEKTRDKAEDSECYVQLIPFEKIKENENLHRELEATEEKIKAIIINIEAREQELKRFLKEKGRKGSFLSRILGPLLAKPPRSEETEKKIDVSKDLLEADRIHLNRMEREYREAQDRIRALEIEIGSFRGKSHEELIHIKQEKQQEQRVILEGRTMEEITAFISRRVNERDELRSTIFRRNSQLLEMDDEAVKRKLEELEQKIIWLADEIENIKPELEEARIGKGEAEKISGRLANMRSQKEELSTKKEVEEIARKTLEEVYIGLKKKFIPQLQERTGAIFEKITRGKYTELVIREEDLEVFVKTPGRLLGTSTPSQGHEDQYLSLKIAHSALSQGTKDQLYLSLRIALSNIVSGGKTLPLIFDESFYTSDKSRLKETFAVLQHIAQTNQILLFTHNEEFLGYGNPIALASGGQ